MRYQFFFVRELQCPAQDLVLQSLLPQYALELADTLLQSPHFRTGDDLIVRPDRFLPALGHAPSPPEDQAGRNTMTAGHVGNRHAGLCGFRQDCKLLVHRVAPATLDRREDFDSIDTAGHSRMTRRTPSSSLCSYVRSKWGPLQPPPTIVRVPPYPSNWCHV